MSNFVSSAQAPFRLKSEQSSFITQLIATGRGRSLVVAVALGIALNRFCSLPGGDVDSPEEFFNNQAGADAVDAMQVINEVVPVDYRTALELCKNLYLVRYELAQCPFKAFGVDRSCGIASIFGLNAHISPDILDVMRCNGQAITETADRFYQVIKALRKE